MTNESTAARLGTQRVKEAPKMQTKYILRLAQELREKHAEGHSWRDVSTKCKILTDEGKPNPGLAKMIADGYQPSTAVMARIFKKPLWLVKTTTLLRNLEASHPDKGPRVYDRDGRRVSILK